MKTPATYRWGQVAGALVLSLAVGHSSVAVAPSEPTTEFDWTAWPVSPVEAPHAYETPVPAPTSTPEPTAAPRPSARPEVTTRPVAVRKTPERATTTRGSSLRSISGEATWYCNRDASRGPISACMAVHPDTSGFNAYAAAGPRLRAALGPHWRGRVVSVNGVPVTLADWCACGGGRRLIDLYADVSERLGLLRRGKGQVVVRW